MSATALALISAFGFAATQVTAKRGLKTVSVEASLMVSLAFAWIVIAAATLLSSPEPIGGGSVLVFALIGLVAPGISRWASVTGLDRLGPSISNPLQQGARPLLSVLGSVVLLGEQVGWSRAAGIACVVAGGWILGTVRAEQLSEDVQEEAPRSRRRTRAIRAGIVFPLLAAASYATSDIVLRGQLGRTPEPFLGAAISMGTACIAWNAVALAVPRVRRRLRFGAGTRWFILSGILAGVANLTLFSALEKGEVSLVAPTVGSQPLIVILLSWILLRGIEHVERTTILGGLLIVAGTTLVSL